MLFSFIKLLPNFSEFLLVSVGTLKKGVYAMNCTQKLLLLLPEHLDFLLLLLLFLHATL